MGNVYTAIQTKDGIASIDSYASITDKNALGGRFLRIKGTNKMIKVQSILTESPPVGQSDSSSITKYGDEKYRLKEKILSSDIKDGILIDGDTEYVDNLLKLINEQFLDKSKEIRIWYEGKLVSLEPELYNMLGYKEKEDAEEQQYYRTRDNKFLKKESITPPAFKQMTDEEVKSFFDRGNGGTVYDQYKKFAMVKYVDEENKSHYIRNAKVKYEFNKKTGVFDALIEVEETLKNGAKRINLKSVPNIATPSAKMSSSIKVISRSLTGVNDQYAIYNEDGTVRANIEVNQARSENKKLRIHHKLNGRTQDIEITNDSLKVNGFTCALKSANFKYVSENETEHTGSLYLDFEVVSIKDVVLENGEVVGLRSKDGKELRLDSFPFGIKFKGELIKDAVNTNRIAVFKESSIFKRDEKGKSVLDADLIQTSAVGPDGECLAYDYNERASVFYDFEKNVDKLKEISRRGLKNGQDIEIISNLQKNIRQQLSKLGDYEAAKDIEEKRKILEEEQAKTGNDRDEKAIEKAKQDYENAVSNAKLGFYKDSSNLNKIDELISRYQQGEFYPTFYIDESGNRVEINSGELTTITSNLPFDWSKVKGLDSIIGKDKVSFDKASGKAKISFSSNAKETVVASAKLAGMLLNASFTLGPASLLIMPITLPLAGVSLAVSGVTAVAETIRTKTKQAKINAMKPQDLKNMQNHQLKSCMDKEFKEAFAVYKEELQRADRNFTSEENPNNLKREAENAFRQRRKEIFNQYLLAASGSIFSKFNNKEKKITNENIYGFLEFRRRREDILKGKDPSTDLTVQEYKKAAEKKYKDEVKNLEDLYGHDRKLLAARRAQLEVDKNNAENEFLSEFGPLGRRVDYLKKTAKYYRASKSEREQMVKDCKAKCEEALKSISVEEVAVKGEENSYLEGFKKDAIAIARLYMPKLNFNGKVYDDEKNLTSSEFNVPISVSSEEKHLSEEHQDKEVEEIEEVFKTYEKLDSKCQEILDENNHVKAAHAVAELFDEQGKVEERLKGVLKDADLVEKVLEDINLWKDQNVDPNARQLNEFINELEAQKDKRKFLSEQYSNRLKSKIKQKISDLKEEFKDDEQVLEVLKIENLKRIQQNLATKKMNSRYGVEATMNEKFMKFFDDAESKGEKKRDFIIKIHKNLLKDEQVKLEKENEIKQAKLEKEKETKRNMAIKMAKDFIATLDVKTYNKYVGIIEIIENSSEYSKPEVDKAIKFILKKQREMNLSKPEISA